MNKLVSTILASLVILTICVPTLISAEPVEIISHTFNINEYEDAYQITEHLSVSTASITNTSSYSFSLPQNAYELQTTIDHSKHEEPEITDDIYILNFSSINNTDEILSIDLTYYVPLTTVYFEKMFLSTSLEVNIEYEDALIFSSKMQQSDSSIKVKLVKTQAPESFNSYSIILIILLVIIIIVTAWYALHKRKNVKGRDRDFESTELLEIEKDLLLNLLKDIEKMHRNQKISDDSYHKLKSYYKQQTVDIMSSLDKHQP